MITAIVVVAAVLIAGLLFALFLNLVAESDDEADFILADEKDRLEAEALEAQALSGMGLTTTTL